MGTRVRTEPWPLSSLPCALGPTPSACEGLCRCWAPGGASVLGRPLALGLLAKQPAPRPPRGPPGSAVGQAGACGPRGSAGHKGPFRSLPSPARRQLLLGGQRLLGSGHPPGPGAGRPWEAGVTHGARPGRSLAQDPCWGLRSGGDSQAALS